MAQRAKDPAVSLLWYRFDPWRQNFHLLQAWPKGRNKTTKQKCSPGRSCCGAMGSMASLQRQEAG